jgi:hypothetical protein
MIVALWMTPALLAGLFAILWATTRLERLVVTALVAGETPVPSNVETRLAPTAARATTAAIARADSKPTSHYFVKEGGPCTSEEGRSS